MELNSQINTFAKGMNMDTDITMIPEGQYCYAENIRMLTNADGTTGMLQNIEHIRQYDGGIPTNETILGTSTARLYDEETDGTVECGIVFTKKLDENGKNYNTLYRVTGFKSTKLSSEIVVQGYLGIENNVSIVTNYESKNVSNIYICDGLTPIKVINMYDSNIDPNEVILDHTKLDITPGATLLPFTFVNTIAGALPAGCIQYCYQLFNLNGSETATSSLSEVIPLTKYDKIGSSAKVKGQTSGELTDRGCQIHAKFTNDGRFDRARIFSIIYLDNTSVPDIYIINEIEVPPAVTDGFTEFTYNDNGSSFLSKITIDEFNAMIPFEFNAKCVEKMGNRLYAANIKELTWDIEDTYDTRAYRCNSSKIVRLESSDVSQTITGTMSNTGLNVEVPKEHDCINPYNLAICDDSATKYIYGVDSSGELFEGGVGENISYRFVYAELVLSSTDVTGIANDLEMNAQGVNGSYICTYYDDGTTGPIYTLPTAMGRAIIPNYADPYICANFLGYKRDEIYRFGIIFYNNKNIPSPVHWIGDIRMPSTVGNSDMSSFVYPFHTGVYSKTYGRNVEQLAYALGIEFDVKTMPKDALSWEIVRCDRTESDRTIISQGIISSLIDFGKMENPGDHHNNDAYSFGDNDVRPMPLFNLGSEFHTKFWIWNDASNLDENASLNKYPRTENYLEFVSPEVCVAKEQMLSSIQNAYLKCLYKVATFNDKYPLMEEYKDGTTIQQLGYKQANVDVVYDDGTMYNDKWFGGIALDKDKNQLYFHGGSGPGFTPDDYKDVPDSPRYWYEKQVLFKYYNTQYDSVSQYYSIDDAIIGMILPYQNNINDSKNHAQVIGNKMYTNTSIAGFTQYGNHGTNCVMKLADNFTLNTGTNGNLSQTFNYINTSYIANIKRQIIPYNGNTYISRQNSTYITCGIAKQVKDPTAIYFGGDTYLSIFDYLNTASCQKSNDPKDQKSLRMNTVCYIPLESVVNTNLFSSDSYHTTAYGNSGNNLIQNEPIVLGNGYAQEKPLYEYNPVYSAVNGAKQYVPKSIYSIDDLLSQCRIVVSEAKSNNEITNSWTKFKFANYIDVDSQYGQITNLKAFNNKLFYWQDNAVGIASVNERSLITDDNMAQLTLGTGGILARFDYVATLNGSSIVNDKSITNSATTIYWYDFDKNEICMLGQGVTPLSKTKNVQSYLNSLPRSAKDNVVSFYDKKYNEVWFRIYDKSLIYNEQLQVFTSFYTHNPNWFFPFSDKLITIKNNNMYYLHNIYEVTHDDRPREERISKIEFVVNKDISNTKVFDNVTFTADLFDVDNQIPLIVKNITFKTKTQQTQPFDHYDTNLKRPNITLREDDYQFAIPREKPSENPMQQLQSQSYLGRMRGKYLICDYTFDCNNNREFKLPYIKTTYRYSML